ncbi:transcriptional regulator [Paenibacillus sp. J31TS4]|uniref:DUF4188 domain-containing protein n=1 Tax=Paenibacillus sp. J31TS4 TaxID=2807195 RepID=UPI001B04FAAC|nr:DUF4188 domain-containing protein [Paenibacillus sp. J31TS4]GIP37199.1 transcriptional regulator [Paenibacillus sp. J31TS4]
MATVIPGRYTAELEGPFVVFMIGMRINRLWAVHKWLPVFRAMTPMMKELYTNKEELGFLDASFYLSARGPMIVQYWRSFEHLEQYARQGAHHLQAWRDFNRKVGTSGTVGIWHETYLVEDGRYECLYNNMPRFGLARAGGHLPALGRRETAARRLGQNNEPAVPSPPNPA